MAKLDSGSLGSSAMAAGSSGEHSECNPAGLALAVGFEIDVGQRHDAPIRDAQYELRGMCRVKWASSWRAATDERIQLHRRRQEMT